jgi:cytochrome c oxidase assembly protein subunit 15
VLTAAASLVLVAAGALVTSTGSGLAVPDWPLSYGMLFPPMVGGILYEHGHRMIAAVVGTMTALIALWAWRRESRRDVQRLAVAALGAVVVQALLGGLTVLLLLPTGVSVAHAGLATVFFALIVLLAVVTSPAWAVARRVEAPSGRLRALATVLCGVVYGQLLLGAWTRHSGAGLAIPDFPLSFGRLVPPLSEAGLEAVAPMLWRRLLPPVTAAQVAVHFAHRIGAVVVAGVAGALVWEVQRRYRTDGRLVRLAGLLAGLVIAQMALGAATVWTLKGVVPATAHVAVGALLFAASVVVVAYDRQHYRSPAPAGVADAPPVAGRARA